MTNSELSTTLSDSIHESPDLPPWERKPDIIQGDNVTRPQREPGAENREEDERDYYCLWQEPEDSEWKG